MSRLRRLPVPESRGAYLTRYLLWLAGFIAAAAAVLGGIALAVQAWDGRPQPPPRGRRQAPAVPDDQAEDERRAAAL